MRTENFAFKPERSICGLSAINKRGGSMNAYLYFPGWLHNDYYESKELAFVWLECSKEVQGCASFESERTIAGLVR